MSGHQRPALDVLAELRRGRLQVELTDALHELLAACTDTGKKGQLVLTLTIEPKKVNELETPQITVTDQINTKKPRRSVLPSTFFLDDTGNPTRRDPHQEEFESMRSVSTETADATGIRKAN
jgi:hypothetical protein